MTENPMTLKVISESPICDRHGTHYPGDIIENPSPELAAMVGTENAPVEEAHETDSPAPAYDAEPTETPADETTPDAPNVPAVPAAEPVAVSGEGSVAEGAGNGTPPVAAMLIGAVEVTQ